MVNLLQNLSAVGRGSRTDFQRVGKDENDSAKGKKGEQNPKQYQQNAGYARGTRFRHR
jgi:hypothetical protein